MLDSLQRINLLKLSGFSSVLGIDLTEKRARVVELAMKGGLLNKFKSTFAVKNYFTVPFSEGSTKEERSAMLAQEIKLRKITTKHAATSIQSIGVRTINAKIPRSVNNVNEWIEENYEKLIRIPISLHEMSFRYEILTENQSFLSVEITFVRNPEIENVQQFLNSVGLLPISLTAGTRDALNTLFYYDAGFRHDQMIFHYYSDSDITVSEYQKQDRIWSYSVEIDSVEQASEPDHNIIAGETDRTNAFQVFSIPTEYTLAVGCALKGCISELHPLDFLPLLQVRSNTESVQKSLFYRTVFASGGILLIVLIIQTILSTYLSSVNEQIESRLADSGLDYTELTLLEKQNSELKIELEKRNSREFRSNIASVLHDIAAAVPDGLWLHKIETNAETRKTIVAGYTSNGDRIAEFLKRCESLTIFQDVRLIRSGIPQQNENMSVVSIKISNPVTFQIQAMLRMK